MNDFHEEIIKNGEQKDAAMLMPQITQMFVQTNETVTNRDHGENYET